MTLITAFGCVGIGLIWGWWIGNLTGRITRPMLDVLVLGIASLLLAIYVFILVDWWALLFFLSAGELALIFHIEWREELINRFGSPRF